MSKKNKKIEVKGREITVFSANKQDYILLTDIAKYKTKEPKILLSDKRPHQKACE